MNGQPHLQGSRDKSVLTEDIPLILSFSLAACNLTVKIKTILITITITRDEAIIKRIRVARVINFVFDNGSRDE